MHSLKRTDYVWISFQINNNKTMPNYFWIIFNTAYSLMSLISYINISAYKCCQMINRIQYKHFVCIIYVYVLCIFIMYIYKNIHTEYILKIFTCIFMSIFILVIFLVTICVNSIYQIFLNKWIDCKWASCHWPKQQFDLLTSLLATCVKVH